MNKTSNILTVGYMPLTSFSNVFDNVKHFFRTLKYAYQRITKGYSDWDTWDLDEYYTRLFIDSLRDLAKNTHGYPGNEEFPTYESWTEYLNKIANLFEESLEETDEGKNKYQAEYDKVLEADLNSTDFLARLNSNRNPEEQEIVSKWCDEEKRMAEVRVEKRNEALNMMAYVFDHLWD